MDEINLTPDQIKGLVYHLNEELYRQFIQGKNTGRVISDSLLKGCVNCYNTPSIPNSIDEED
tara:strand:- start:3417 stop:3602 length:186 start_codon:yes stop_codon:yes gene_type:complete